MTWARDQRLSFIRRIVETDGKINRADVIRQFSISSPQASCDFREVLARWPDVMRYDPAQRAYVRIGLPPVEAKPRLELAPSAKLRDDLLEVSLRHMGAGISEVEAAAGCMAACAVVLGILAPDARQQVANDLCATLLPQAHMRAAEIRAGALDRGQPKETENAASR